MIDSILISIRLMLGIGADVDVFDAQIIPLINSALSNLCQIGVGPSEGFFISGPDETWKDFLGERLDIEHAKSYVYFKTRIIFDPPATGAAMDAMKQMADKYEWLLNVAADKGVATSGE